MRAMAAVAGWIFLARTGLRGSQRDALLLGAVVAVTALVVTIVPLWFGQTADSVLRARLGEASVSQRGLEFERPNSRLAPVADDPLAVVTAQTATLTAELPSTLRGVVSPPDVVVDTIELVALDAPRPILRLRLRIEDVATGIRWAAGRPPTGRPEAVEVTSQLTADGRPRLAIAYEVALSTGTAAAAGLAVGDRLVMVPGTAMPGTLVVDVVGLFEVMDPADERWFGDSSLAVPLAQRVSMESTIYHAVALVDEGAYPFLYGATGTVGEIEPSFDYRWRYRVDPTRVATDRVGELAVDLARLRAAHPFGGGVGAPSLSTGFADLVGGYRTDRAATATAIAVAMVGPLAAMIGALAFLAAAAGSRRAAGAATLRSRGGRQAQVVVARALENLVVAVPAALAGGLAAALLVAGRWVEGALWPALAVGLVAAALATAPAIVWRGPSTGRDPGPGSRRASRRLVLDLLVLAIAAGAAVSLRDRELLAGGELNLFLASVPALLALAGAVGALRLYPALVRMSARAAERRDDLVAVHGLRGVERGAAGQQVPLAAIVLAVSVAAFAALALGTLDRAEARSAVEAVGADYRLAARAGGRLPGSLDPGAVSGVERVATAATVDGSLLGQHRISAPIDVVVLDVPAWMETVAGSAMELRLPPELARPPMVDAGTPESPVPVLVGDATLERLGLAPGDAASLTVANVPVHVRAFAAGSRFPGLGDARSLVIIDRAAAGVALPGVPLLPSLAFLRAPAEAETALRAAIAPVASQVDVTSRDEVLAGIRASPLVGAVRTGYGAAAVIALLYTLGIVALAARQALVARRRELAVLRALGLPSADLGRLLAVEVGPLVIVSLLAGLALGGIVAALVVPGLRVDRLVGLDRAPSIAADPFLLVVLGAAPVAGAVVAVAAGARGVRRTDLAAATREVEP